MNDNSGLANNRKEDYLRRNLKREIMRNFKEGEIFCRNTFDANGPYWHLYTQGHDTPLIFREKEDYVFAMNIICQAAFEFPQTQIITFEVMGNHLHFLLTGEKETAQQFFSFIRKRLALGLKETFPDGLPKTFSATIKPVTDLNALRNTIVYINRNGFVADQTQTPYSYPWGAGRYYYNEFPVFQKLKDFKIREVRRMFRGRTPSIPEDCKVIDGYIAPSSYCCINLGMAFFRNAHHYISLLFRNVEAYSEMALELGDSEASTDNELYSQLSRIIQTRYNLSTSKDLTKAQKTDLARTLRNTYRSSNSQISRVLGLSLYEVDTMFPLTAKRSD